MSNWTYLKGFVDDELCTKTLVTVRDYQNACKRILPLAEAEGRVFYDDNGNEYVDDMVLEIFKISFVPAYSKEILEENQRLALENQELRDMVKALQEQGQAERKDAKTFGLDAAIDNAAGRSGPSGEGNSRPRKKDEHSF